MSLSECLWSVLVLEEQMNALIRPSPPPKELSSYWLELLHVCSAVTHHLCGSGGQRTHIAIFFFLICCQGQCLACRRRPCTAGVTGIYEVVVTMTILALRRCGYNFRSRGCVSHQSRQQTKHLLIIINKRCGRLRLRALFSLQVWFLLGFWFFPPCFAFFFFLSDMQFSIKWQNSYRNKEHLEVFLYLVQIRSAKASQKSLTIIPNPDHRVPVGHHGRIHAVGSEWTHAFKVNVPYNLKDRSIRAQKCQKTTIHKEPSVQQWQVVIKLSSSPSFPFPLGFGGKRSRQMTSEQQSRTNRLHLGSLCLLFPSEPGPSPKMWSSPCISSMFTVIFLLNLNWAISINKSQYKCV